MQRVKLRKAIVNSNKVTIQFSVRFESQERRFKERVHIEGFSDIWAQPNSKASTYDSMLPTANALEYVLTMTEISPFLPHVRNVVWTEATPINSHSTKYPRPVPGWRTNLKGIQRL